MNNNRSFLGNTLLSVAALALTSVCTGAESHDHAAPSAAANAGLTHLVAVMAPTAGATAAGTVFFEALVDGRIKVTATMTGLQPGATHAIHIHTFGDVRATNGTSAGGHYNPAGHPHALPKTAERHAGDLGNLHADAQGKAHYTLTVDNLSLAGEMNPIIGRGVVVHAKEDDGGQPTGNAGARLAVGVIGIMNTEFTP